MSNLILGANKAQFDNIEGVLREAMGDLDKMLPATVKKLITPERLVMVTLNGVATPNDRGELPVLKCSPVSILNAMFIAAQLGLEQHGALIPYAGVATFQPMYRGMIVLLVRGNHVVGTVHADHRYTKDRWIHRRGSNPEFGFEVMDYSDRGDLMGAFAYAKIPNDPEYLVQFDNVDELDKVRGTSVSWKSDKKNNTRYSPWTNWEPQMQLKTEIKRLFKKVPVYEGASEIALAANYDDLVEITSAEEIASEARHIGFKTVPESEGKVNPKQSQRAVERAAKSNIGKQAAEDVKSTDVPASPAPEQSAPAAASETPSSATDGAAATPQEAGQSRKVEITTLILPIGVRSQAGCLKVLAGLAEKDSFDWAALEFADDDTYSLVVERLKQMGEIKNMLEFLSPDTEAWGVWLREQTHNEIALIRDLSTRPAMIDQVVEGLSAAVELKKSKSNGGGKKVDV